VLNTGISDFLEERFGTGSIDNTVEDAVENMLQGLMVLLSTMGRTLKAIFQVYPPGLKIIF
jgi:hypothetical protein